jgi:hypothetical protein
VENLHQPFYTQVHQIFYVNKSAVLQLPCVKVICGSLQKHLTYLKQDGQYTFKEITVFCLPVGNLNLKEANRVSVDKGYVGGNVPIDSGTAVGVQLPIQTVCRTAQTHIGSSRGMHWI